MGALIFVPFSGTGGGGGGPPTGPAGGDLRGDYPDPEVTGIQGAPFDNEALEADLLSVPIIDEEGVISWRRLTQDDILPGFDILTLTKTAPNGGTLLYRRGDELTGLTATASYESGPPDAASIANTLGGSTGGGDINPPANWDAGASPFTAWAMSGSVKRDGSNMGADPTMTVTLSATKGILVDTRSFQIVWTSDVWWGVGPAGYNSQSDIESLANTQLSTAKARTLTLSPANQKVYYAYPQQRGTSAWTLEGIGVDLLPPTTVSMTVNGITRDYYLYETTNLLTGSGLNFVVV